ncbi:DUF7619 domain-containing protein [Psychroserpens sp.]
MRKLLLILGFVLFVQTNDIIAQTIELPNELYLCESVSIELDGTVINTTDTNITYQWYYGLSFSSANDEIVGATSPIFTVNGNSNERGYYKVVATLSDNSNRIDWVQIVKSAGVNDYEFVQCNNFFIEELQSEYYLSNASNITIRYYENENDAIAGNNNNATNFFIFEFAIYIYLRIEENSGLCVDILTLEVISDTYLYANWVPNMGSCSSDSSGVFDLTTNDNQIIGGQSQAVVDYFETYSDAENLLNPIFNTTNYVALSPNQTIYARVYDSDNINFGCFAYDSITQFQLLSVSEPTPNTELDYIVCDTSSGSATDGIGAFNLNSRNALVLSGLSTFQYNISYYNTLVDAENNTNAIASPNNYIASNEVVYVRVESSANSECVQISQLNLLVQDACDDISVSLLSYWAAPRPGFTYRNILIVKNNGESTVSSGTVEFTNDALVTYSGATGLSAGNTITPIANGFTLDFIDLLPGESEVIYIELLVPASANLGDMITNVAEYTTSENDVVIENNTATLSEIIIGSYDPNDIAESHGPEIQHTSFTEDDYLYYTIRFQNVGTASAVNVTIDNVLDPKLDKTTFQMLRASHSYGIERDFDKLTWQFNNINLADETSDEPNSHGYVYYKIKPLAGYSVGDIVPNTASIVFDFNAPVITNTFNTEFVDVLGIQDFSLNAQFILMPNPSTDFVSLKFNSMQSNVEITIFDILGKMIFIHKEQQASIVKLNISPLESGVYFVKIKDHNGQFGLKKLIKE